MSKMQVESPFWILLQNRTCLAVKFGSGDGRWLAKSRVQEFDGSFPGGGDVEQGSGNGVTMWPPSTIDIRQSNYPT
ncbi:hypothetical protein CIHG_09003 [Coccidioides immitis H538.4]|uniref:Uncharacterized protein n=3 Tax=Coccidioides immitis TaxID=5501 RepID=A0A0J8QM66_COCIT|nr:hypothetical protein CIRG_04090 [Coccidioides immitis RMSCC 2394]KMU73536.1 hypothetical protein CISG_03669 [Coccidioides immitis RMSCC 3703]KMU91068.1 hypothetical protein CIHG_09003 [Coccidioides immitis H538.4]